jgi:hypothetical protein
VLAAHCCATALGSLCVNIVGRVPRQAVASTQQAYYTNSMPIILVPDQTFARRAEYLTLVLVLLSHPGPVC